MGQRHLLGEFGQRAITVTPDPPPGPPVEVTGDVDAQAAFHRVRLDPTQVEVEREGQQAPHVDLAAPLVERTDPPDLRPPGAVPLGVLEDGIHPPGVGGDLPPVRKAKEWGHPLILADR